MGRSRESIFWYVTNYRNKNCTLHSSQILYCKVNVIPKEGMAWPHKPIDPSFGMTTKNLITAHASNHTYLGVIS